MGSTPYFDVDAPINATGSVPSDMGAQGIKADVIAESTSAAGVTIDSVLCKDGSVTVGTGGQVKTDTIAEKTSAAGVTIDGVLLKDGAVTGSVTGNASTATAASSIAAAGVFLSTEQTGNGSEQSVAHGLGSTPVLAYAIPSDLTGGAYTVAYGTHDSTNVNVTVTTGEKYRVVAFK